MAKIAGLIKTKGMAAECSSGLADVPGPRYAETSIFKEIGHGGAKPATQ
ncbi:MAG: hypothetical protein ABFD69_05160 [Candidatus Sumerlaeia bacterium]